MTNLKDKFVLTVKNYSDFQDANLGDDFLSEVTMISMLTGMEPNKIKNTEFDGIKSELAEQLVAEEPVYLFKWKGKMYGYYASDIETIGEVVELSTLEKTKKWNFLCSFCFREVTNSTRFAHMYNGGWKKFHGVDVKFISNFSNDYAKYKCKKVKDWNKVDHTIWDDFPFEILASNMGFLVGNGLSLSLSIHASSPKLLEKQTKMIQKFQILMASMASSWILQRKDQESRKRLGITPSQISHQDSSSIFLHEKTSRMLLKSITNDLWVFKGDVNEEIIDKYAQFATELWLSNQFRPESLRFLSSIGLALRLLAKESFSWSKLLKHG